MPDPEVPTPSPAPTPSPSPPAPTPGPVTPSDWRSGLPEDLRAEKSLESFKGEKWDEVGPALAKSFVETKKLVGASLRIPGPDATPAEVAAFRSKLGVPDSPDKYEIARPELPEGFSWNDAQEKQFRDVAHGLGLTPSQVQKLVDFDAARQAGMMDSMTQHQAESRIKGEEALRKEWGPAKYDRGISLAKTALRRFGSEPLVQHLESSGMGNHPDFVKFMATIGEQLLEDGYVKGEVTDFTTKSEARRKLDSLLSDPKGAYYTRGPDHDRAVEEVRGLYEILNSPL